MSRLGDSSADLLARADVALRRAGNPGPLTLSGTNSWIAGRNPAWVVDPGPALDEHLDALAAEVRARGGAGGIALTHSHADHAAGVEPLLARLKADVPVGAADADAVTPSSMARALADGDAFGPLGVLALPGHAADHLGFALDSPIGLVCFTGDAVLGEGSVFVSSDMAAYLEALQRLRDLAPALILPGHGPPVTDTVAHVAAYRAHRMARERDVLAAWKRGIRDERALLAVVWGPLPARLQAPATVTLRAHLEKLRDEGRLGEGA